MSPISGTKKRPPGVPPGVPPVLTDEEKDDDDYEDDSSDGETGLLMTKSIFLLLVLYFSIYFTLSSKTFPHIKIC